jgi:hypothetical protein
VISRNFHLYTPSHLSTLPAVLLGRVLHRARSDRGYEAHGADRQRNPDATTFWAYMALLDPGGGDTDPDHTLAMPLAPTLHYLKPDETLAEPEHPLISLPKLYERESLDTRSPLSFLTTLTLDGMNGSVNDTTVMNVRYCTHLSLLWTRGCKITDTAVRLLSSSLDLQRKTGLCRLRAWFLPGCRGVSDRSMRSLARWPGLTVVDVRDTSVTNAGMGVLNRFSQSYFNGQNADFQPCTDGLLPVFSSRSTPAEILEALCLTLLLPPTPGRGQIVGRSHTPQRWWIALHLVPTTEPLDPKWLPHPPARIDPATSASAQSTHPSRIYRPGVGMIYCQNASNVPDEVTAYRANLRTALRIQAEEEGLCDPLHPPDGWDDPIDSFGDWDPDNSSDDWDDPIDSPDYWDQDRDWDREERKHALNRVKDGYEAPMFGTDRSKAFVMGTNAKSTKSAKSAKSKASRGREKDVTARGTGTRVDDERDAEVIGGDRELMLVRMVAQNWETLQWTLGSEARDTNAAVPVKVGGNAQRLTSGDLVAAILGTRGAAKCDGKPDRPPGRYDLSPGSSAASQLTSKPSVRHGHTLPINPFSAAPSQASSGAGSQASTASFPSSGSFATQGGFSSTAQKRRFEGGGTAVEVKRRGMKMFSVGAKPL